MKLYWAPQTRSPRAFWMLEEAEVEYDTEIVDIRAENRLDSEEFRRASPMGKVPALVDGNVLLSESAAICVYVADRYAPGRLAPALSDDLRGQFLYWSMYTPGVIEPAMAEHVNKVAAKPTQNGWGSFDAMIATLADGLEEREWILGGSFSAADVLLGSSVIFLQMFKMLPENKRLEEYAGQCKARPAFQRSMDKSSA